MDENLINISRGEMLVMNAKVDFYLSRLNKLENIQTIESALKHPAIKNFTLVNQNMNVSCTEFEGHTAILVKNKSREFFVVADVNFNKENIGYMRNKYQKPIPYVKMEELARNAMSMLIYLKFLVPITTKEKKVNITHKETSIMTDFGVIKEEKIEETKIEKVVYKDNNVGESKEKHSYEIKKESWAVRGHYREYKNGKKVWVKPYKKGKEQKTIQYYKN